MMKGRDYLRDPRGPFDPGDTIIITSQSEEATFALKPLDLRVLHHSFAAFLAVRAATPSGDTLVAAVVSNRPQYGSVG